MNGAICSQAIVQIAYVVDDIRAAALKHSRLYGSGPFFIAEHVSIPIYRHRETEQIFDHSAAFGQCGDLMIELMQQHNDAPSHIHDMYPAASGRTGLHHAAMFVQNLEQSVNAYKRDGFEIAATGAGSDFRAVIIDATQVYGHMIELYERDPGLVRLFDLVRIGADGWDGKDPLRDIAM
jgi:hypothetical protein